MNTNLNNNIVYVISHTTRKDGEGDLNGEIFSTFEKAKEIVSDYVKNSYTPEYIKDYWDSDSEFCSEDEQIVIDKTEIR